MTLTDHEMRHLAISLLNTPTERDAQTRVGASNLSNGCDYCLAAALSGVSRDSPATDRAWMGRTLGTSLHATFEGHANSTSPHLSWFQDRYPDAEVEQHLMLGTLGGYGEMGGTPDLYLPTENHLIDWKSSTRKKTALMRDCLGQTTYGRTHAALKLSEKVYAEEIEKANYKVTSYYGQTQTYMLGKRRAGIPAEKATLVFVNRDGTGWFDDPLDKDYENLDRMQDVWVLSFDYNESYALQVWDRGIELWDALQSGKALNDFESDPLCFPCGLDRVPETATTTTAQAALPSRRKEP